MTTTADRFARDECPPRVLIADDDPSIRRLARRLLERAGYDVIVAEDGHQAARLMAETPPALFLLDRSMPGLDGLALCRAIQEDPLLRQRPVIFLTALDKPEDKRQAFRAGAVDYVTKPIEPVELLARIGTHITLARSRAELTRHAERLASTVADQGSRLDQVRRGQAALLTEVAPLEGMRAEVRLRTAHEAGGDFYDVREVGPGVHDALLADVAGHDLSSAYVSGAIKALFTACADAKLSVAEICTRMNETLVQILEPQIYATGCYIRCDATAQELTLLHAGHPPAVALPPEGGPSFVSGHGDLLGFHAAVEFELAHLPWLPGTRLFTYSDGLVEGYRNQAGSPLPTAQVEAFLLAAVADTRHLALADAIDVIDETLSQERNCAEEDDVVLLGIEI